MAPENVLMKWFGRNWPLVITGVVLVVGVGALLTRSTEHRSPPAPAAEAAVVVVPGEVVIVPGRATVVLPGGDNGAKSALISDAGVVD